MFGSKYGFQGAVLRWKKIPHTIGKQILHLKYGFGIGSGIGYGIGRKYRPIWVSVVH